MQHLLLRVLQENIPTTYPPSDYAGLLYNNHVQPPCVHQYGHRPHDKLGR